MSGMHPPATACAEVLALVYVYIDDEIDQSHRVEVFAHLQECVACWQEYDAQARLKARVGRACACPPPPEALRLRIRSQIQRISISVSTELAIEQDSRRRHAADDSG